MNNYTGYKRLQLNDSELELLYTNKYKSNFLENEYLILEKDSNVIDYFQYKNDKFERVKFPIIQDDMIGSIKPRNPE